MKLHRAQNHADWDSIDPQARNVWQRLAVHTYGLLTPGNVISVLGMVLVLVGLLVMAAGEFWKGLGILAAGRVADILDGIAADRTGTKSPLGEMVDAVIDKMAAITVLVFFMYYHWIPILPMIFVALQVGVNSVLALTARIRNISLHPSAAGKFAAVGSWVVLLAFPAATAADHASLHGLHMTLIAIAYMLTAIFAVLTLQAIAGYYIDATAGLARPLHATTVFSVTGMRIIAVPVIFLEASVGHWLVVFLLTVVAFSSDFLDGWLARRWKVVSTFGMTFDPLADKVVCLTLLAVIAAYSETWYWLLFAVFAIYDVCTMTIRFISPRPMPASKAAKYKTALLMVGLLAVIAGIHILLLRWLGGLLVVAAAILSFRSLRGYIRSVSRSFAWLEHATGVATIDFGVWHSQYGIKTVLFDVDGTLAPWARAEVDETIVSAIQHARKAGIRHVGIVTNSNPAKIARIAKIATRIEASTYHAPNSWNERKPNPFMIHAALDKLGGRSSEAGFVGDKLVDVLAARRAGIARVAWVQRLGTEDHILDRLLYRPVERFIKYAIR